MGDVEIHYGVHGEGWACAVICEYGSFCVVLSSQLLLNFPLDLDECSTGVHTCHAKAKCTNTVGSYTCQCNPGFQGDGHNCTDVDECSNGTHTCQANAQCTNTVGSYTCQCNPGFQGDGHNCTGSGLPACSSYSELGDRTRHVSYETVRAKCDSGMSLQWYRLTGAAGTRMPTSCVPFYRCGTNVVGWLNGSHPTVLEGIVSRTVCFHWTLGCCEWSDTIRVLNCGAFYVYEFKPPSAGCSLRYCGTN